MTPTTPGMGRDAILSWLENHRASIAGEPNELLERCERAVRRHATEAAWIAAKSWAERRRREFEAEGWGNHASEAFVASEVCHQLAWELAHHEPSFAPGSEERLAGGPLRRRLEPRGWHVLEPWIRELAASQERAVWSEIVRFTHRRARSLVRERHLSRDCDLDRARHYPQIAAEVAGELAREYSRHAYPP
jgi:hypothetical protein